jgi:hypothetical protein
VKVFQIVQAKKYALSLELQFPTLFFAEKWSKLNYNNPNYPNLIHRVKLAMSNVRIGRSMFHFEDRSSKIVLLDLAVPSKKAYSYFPLTCM